MESQMITCDLFIPFESVHVTEEDNKHRVQEPSAPYPDKVVHTCVLRIPKKERVASFLQVLCSSLCEYIESSAIV